MSDYREVSNNKNSSGKVNANQAVSINNKPLKGSETEKNLYKTFAGESRARIKYELFAEKAKQEGYQWLSDVFSTTGGNELAHARAAYKMFLSLLGDTLSNLKEAIEGETNEYTKVYKEFQETAEKEGFTDIANFYKELREVEEQHAKEFKELADKLEAGKLFKGSSDSKWYCMNCGYIYEGAEAPAICPLCKYPRGYFKEYCPENNK